MFAREANFSKLWTEKPWIIDDVVQNINITIGGNKKMVDDNYSNLDHENYGDYDDVADDYDDVAEDSDDADKSTDFENNEYDVESSETDDDDYDGERNDADETDYDDYVHSRSKKAFKKRGTRKTAQKLIVDRPFIALVTYEDMVIIAAKIVNPLKH